MEETMATGTVRSRVPELMKERGMNIAQLAIAAGVHYNTAKALAKDHTDRIDKNTLAALCEVFGVSTGDILVYVPDRSVD